MFDRSIRFAAGGVLAVAVSLVPTDAWAISCDEILNMVNVNVPTNIVTQTMESSGTKFTADDIRCLANGGAPDDVVSKAREMAAAAEREQEVEEQPTRPTREAEEEERGSSFDKEEALGNNVPAGGDDDDEDAGGGPKQLEELIKLYRAKKVLTASKGFFDLLEENKYPEEESKISYYLAKSLYDMQMYDASQYYFMQVVRKGPKNPYFKYALPKLVAIAQLTGNDSELLRIVDKIPPEAFPRQAKNHLYYLMGRKLYEDGELSGAAKYFEQISSKSDLYLRSKYFEGVIHNERGKLKSAVKSFRDVYQAEAPATDDRQLRELEDLKDLSLMNIGRIYYGLKRFDNAENFYQLVDRDSTYWPESLFERAWTAFLQNDLNHTLGLLLTVRSPYFADEEFIPEVQILRALTFFQLCEYDESEKILLDFEATYGPMREEMKMFLEQYASEENQKLSDQAFDEYFTNKKKQTKLPKALFLAVLRNRDLSALVRQIEQIDREEDLINQQKGAWKDTVGAHLKKILEEDRQRYKKRAGKILLTEMAQQYEALGQLMTQSQIIRFEVVDAQRKGLEARMQGLLVETEDQRTIDFATSKDIIYWPFNGEFWQDELGYYRYTEKSECK